MAVYPRGPLPHPGPLLLPSLPSCTLSHLEGMGFLPQNISPLAPRPMKGHAMSIHSTSVCESLSRVWLFATPWTVAPQVPLSMAFSRILEWVDCPFSSGSSWPRNGTGASCIAGGFFSSWATREAPQHLARPHSSHASDHPASEGRMEPALFPLRVLHRDFPVGVGSLGPCRAPLGPWALRWGLGAGAVCPLPHGGVLRLRATSDPQTGNSSRRAPFLRALSGALSTGAVGPEEQGAAGTAGRAPRRLPSLSLLHSRCIIWTLNSLAYVPASSTLAFLFIIAPQCPSFFCPFDLIYSLSFEDKHLKGKWTPLLVRGGEIRPLIDC